MTLKHTRLFVLLLVSLFSMTAPLAIAQDAPPEAQLELPMGDVPQPQPQEAPSSPVFAPSQERPATSARTDGAFDPCPAPASAINSSPDDLAKVQEDIDRFTLCVARAQLLERLNETATKSEGAIDAALGLRNTIPGVPTPQQNGLAALPEDALAGADVAPMPATPQTYDAAPDQAATPVMSVNTAPKTETPALPATWTISEIFGAGASIQAKVISPEGDEMRVREGSVLRDNGGTVVRITPALVTIRKDSETKDLDWSRQGAP